jgi:hypothetical protein
MARAPIGDEHGGEQGGAAGEDEAVDRDDDRGALEVLELGVLDLAIDLGERFFAAHGEDGVAEGHEDAEEAEQSAHRACL